MNKKQAEKIVQFIEKFEVIFDEVAYESGSIESESERAALKKALGDMFMSRFQIEDILLDQYPEFRDRVRPPDAGGE